MSAPNPHQNGSNNPGATPIGPTPTTNLNLTSASGGQQTHYGYNTNVNGVNVTATWTPSSNSTATSTYTPNASSSFGLGPPAAVDIASAWAKWIASTGHSVLGKSSTSASGVPFALPNGNGFNLNTYPNTNYPSQYNGAVSSATAAGAASSPNIYGQQNPAWPVGVQPQSQSTSAVGVGGVGPVDPSASGSASIPPIIPKKGRGRPKAAVKKAPVSKKKIPQRPQPPPVNPGPVGTSIHPPIPINPAPIPVPPSLVPRATPPMPPNFLQSYESTITSLSPISTIPLAPSSLEYITLSNFLQPLHVTGISQIMNPSLWKRFVNTRKELLRSKSDDLHLLSKLLDEKELHQAAHISLNWTQNPAVLPYSDNMALLFHCTRSKANLDSILTQGLDERLGNAGLTGGLLGRGIYFADCPLKSIQYDTERTGVILVCAVLLGDCLSVDHLPSRNTLVREPEKTPGQKRNLNDLFFDSIVGRPTTTANEYVIYNRSQCCPIYQVNYQRGNSSRNTIYTQRRLKLPSIAWLPVNNGEAMPQPNGANMVWPFYAKTIFTLMGVQDEPEDDLVPVPPPQPEPELPAEPLVPTEEEVKATLEKLKTLSSLGFRDEQRNRELLQKYDNDVNRVVNNLLDSNYNQPSAPTAASAVTTSPVLIDLSQDSPGPGPLKKPKTSKDSKELPDYLSDFTLAFLDSPGPTPAPPQEEECPICYNFYPPSSSNTSNWTVLSCSHKLCTTCHLQIVTTRMTMSGIQHTSTKCPFCQASSGVEIGTCPNGQMRVTELPSACQGYEHFTTWSINYFVPDPRYRLNRTAYIPNNVEGKRVLKLLEKAWDRRLTFTIGTSNTTGEENVLVWNIHHKTALQGGVASHGYPDVGYLDRLRWELKAYGIE